MPLAPLLPTTEPTLVLIPQVPSLEQRAAALIEVILCSDLPTQLLIGATLGALGLSSQNADGSLRLGFVAALMLLDTVSLIGLIGLFMMVRGDRPRDLFLGTRAVMTEARAGLPMIALAFALAAATLLSIRLLMPWLHNVTTNPLQQLLRTPADAGLLALIVVVAGGVREEVQRAFLLNRFERWLGGPTVGVVVTSLAFGAGHVIQGADAAIATGVLGAFWAVVYLRRRSIIAPVVSHAGFDLLQVLQLLAIGSAAR